MLFTSTVIGVTYLANSEDVGVAGSSFGAIEELAHARKSK